MKTLDSLGVLQTFVQVADTLSFVETGRLQGVSASAVGKAVARLEQQLGDRAWFNGEAFGWGDIAVVPYLNGSRGHGHHVPAGVRRVLVVGPHETHVGHRGRVQPQRHVVHTANSRVHCLYAVLRIVGP